MTKQTRFNVWYWVAAFVGILILQYLLITAREVAAIPYSDFERFLKEGKVVEVAVSNNFIQGLLKEPLPGGQSQFVTTRVDPSFAEQLQRYNVRYTGQIESTFLRDLLSWVVPVVFFAAIWMFILRRMGAGLGGGLMQIGEEQSQDLC